MRYWSRFHGESEVEELTEKRARELLEGSYTKKSIMELFESGRGFRLRTMTRDIWTQDDDGLIPLAGYYGIVG